MFSAYELWVYSSAALPFVLGALDIYSTRAFMLPIAATGGDPDAYEANRVAGALVRKFGIAKGLALHWMFEVVLSLLMILPLAVIALNPDLFPLGAAPLVGFWLGIISAAGLTTRRNFLAAQMLKDN